MSLHCSTALLSSEHVPFTLEGIQRARGIAYSKSKGYKGRLVLEKEFVDLLLPRRSDPKKVIRIHLQGMDPLVVSVDQKFAREDELILVTADQLRQGDRLLGLKSLTEDGGSYIVEGIEAHNDMKPSYQLLDVTPVRFSNYALACGIFAHR